MFEQTRGVKRGREQDSDPLLDRHGNAATPKLFVNKLPPNASEQEINDIFSKHEGFTSVQLGSKVLLAGEFRTCVVTYGSSEQAAAARTALQHFQAVGWSTPMQINFVKQEPRDSQMHYIASQHQSQLHPYHTGEEAEPESDSLGNYACPTIFVKNLSPEISQTSLATLFPTNIKISLGTKQLRPGEFRTGYITFEDTAAAVAAKKAMTGYKDDTQQVPLVIYYSVRPQDQPKSSNPSLSSEGGVYGQNMNMNMNMALIPSLARGYHHNPNPAATSSSSLYPTPPSPFTPPAYPAMAYPGGGPLNQSSLRSLSSLTSLSSLPPSLTPAAFHHAYSALHGLYAAGYADPYPPGPGSRPFHGMMGQSLPHPHSHPHSHSHPHPHSHGQPRSPVTQSSQLSPPRSPQSPAPADDARYSIADLFDVKGNAATNSLFVDCLPHDIRENQIHAIFSRSPGFKGLHMGTKTLSANEYRTAIVHFNSTENALRARAKLQHYRDPAWSRPLIIHYSKH